MVHFRTAGCCLSLNWERASRDTISSSNTTGIKVVVVVVVFNLKLTLRSLTEMEQNASLLK